jgi:hypothetical protein
VTLDKIPILVVEDNCTAFEHMEHTLCVRAAVHAYPLKIIRARYFGDAVKKARAHQPHVISIDTSFPNTESGSIQNNFGILLFYRFKFARQPVAPRSMCVIYGDESHSSVQISLSSFGIKPAAHPEILQKVRTPNHDRWAQSVLGLLTHR